MFTPSAKGDLRVVEVVSSAGLEPADLLRLTAWADWPAGHPIGRAIAGACRSLPAADGPATTAGSWRFIPGRGVQGRINGFEVLIGGRPFMRDAGIDLSDAMSRASLAHTAVGQRCLFVAARSLSSASDTETAHRSLLGFIVLADGRIGREPKASRSATLTASSTEPASASVAGLAWWRRTPWRVVAFLVAASAIAGLYGSALRVEADEVAIVHRFGRVVALCEPGLHFRSLWPIERVTRLRPRQLRVIRLELGGPNATAGQGPPPAKAPTDWLREVVAGPVLAPLESRVGGPLSEPRERTLALLYVSATVEYGIGDPRAYRHAAADPDGWLAVQAESTLRESLARVPVDAGKGNIVGDPASAWSELLGRRLSRMECGLNIERLAIHRIEADPGPGGADVAEALESLRQAEAEAQETLAQARRDAEKTLSEARVDADQRLAQATEEEARRLETAHAQARDLEERMAAAGVSPEEGRLRLVRELLNERLPGRRLVVIDPDLDRCCRVSIRRDGQTNAVALWLCATRPAAEGGRP
ncbi:MAG: hypothetical protein HRF43_17630 [Phycisphaerae bacterium]